MTAISVDFHIIIYLKYMNMYINKYIYNIDMYSYIDIHIHKVYTNRSPKQWHPLVPRTRSLDCCP